MAESRNKFWMPIWRGIEYLPSTLDTAARITDWTLNRTHGGLCDRYATWLREKLTWLGATERIVASHPPFVVALFLLLIAGLILAPRRVWDVYDWAIVIACWAAYLLAIFCLPRRLSGVHTWQVLILAIVYAASLKFPDYVGGAAGSAGVDWHRHVLIPLILALLLLSYLFAPLLACTVTVRLRRFCHAEPKLHGRLREADLFERPPSIRLFPKLTDIRQWRQFLLGRALPGIVSVPILELDLLLFPSAVVIVFLPNLALQFWEYWISSALICLGLWWFFLLLAAANSRLNAVVDILRGMFFRGATRVISYALMLLAILRVLGVSYITTVLDGAPTVVWTWFAIAYLVFWLYDYWIDRVLNERLLSLLSVEGGTTATIVTFSTDKPVVAHRVCPDHRRIQLHSGSRLAVVGVSSTGRVSPLVGTDRWQFRRRLDLFRSLILESSLTTRVKRAVSLVADVESEVRKFVEQAKESPKDDSNYTDWERALKDAVTGATGKDLDTVEEADLASADDAIKKSLYPAFLKKSLQHNFNSGQKRAAALVTIKPVDERPAVMPGRFSDKDVALLDEVQRVCQTYFAVMYAPIILSTALVLICSAGWKDLWAGRRVPVVSVASESRDGDPTDNLHDLCQTFFARQREEGAPNRVILLAASGGGTRAALYTASLLHGLHRLKVLDDVKLLSGASGGMLALAYYATHAADLQQSADEADDPCLANLTGPWRAFHRAMAANYIEDVLLGATETRVVSGTPFGTLLAEAFDRVGALDQRIDNRLPPLIFNITLCGKAPSLYNDCTTEGLIVPRFSDALLAGARLVISNVNCRDYFPKSTAGDSNEQAPVSSSEFPDYLEYVVLQDPQVRAHCAAALSANFPPVFSNAGVKVGDTLYWTTDGGVMDNRGVISVLYALRGAFADLKTRHDIEPRFPEFHIVIADASRVELDYRADGGTGAIVNAKTQIANQLIRELIETANREYDSLQESFKVKQKRRRTIIVHYLPMPSVLRMRDGLGTHWMLPPGIRVSPLARSEGEATKDVYLTRDQVRQVIYSLHYLDEDAKCKDDVVAALGDWFENDPMFMHPQAWAGLKRDLLAKDPAE